MVKIERLDANSAVVIIYAYVGSWEFNAEAFQSLLDELSDVELIKIKLHTYGGSVFDGNMISNAIRAAKQRIEIEIVGVVASMGTIVTQAANKVTIVENGFMMIHAPSGYSDGNASAHENTAKMLRSMEKQFKKDYTRRSKRKPEDTAKYLDGQDHWIDAEEALQEGFVDEIVPIEVKGPDEFDLTAVAQLGPKAAFIKFAASLEAAAKPTKQTPDDKNSQMKQALIDKYGLKGVTAESTDTEVQAALDTHFKAMEDKAKEAENTAKATAKATITTMVDEAVGSKITAEQKADFVAIGETAGIPALKTALAAIKPVATITSQIKTLGNGTPVAGREAWDWEKWQKEDPKGLEAMANTDADGFNALYKTHYGVEPAK